MVRKQYPNIWKSLSKLFKQLPENPKQGETGQPTILHVTVNTSSPLLEMMVSEAVKKFDWGSYDKNNKHPARDPSQL